MRLFIAIELPEDIKKELSDAQRRLKGLGVDASWTRAEGMHLTLKFLGEVPEAKVPEIMAAFTKAGASHTGFRLGVAGMGAFPDPRNARVVWARISGDIEKLAMLQSAVEEAMTLEGFDREKRKFTPHLTLGRIKRISSRDRWLNALEELGDMRIPAFEVMSVSLMKSELKPAGAVYTEMGRVELR